MRNPRFSLEQEERCKELCNYRKQLKLEIPEMAEKLGLSAFRLDKIEKGIQPCSEELFDKATELRFPDHQQELDDDQESVYLFLDEGDRYFEFAEADEYDENPSYEERAHLEFDRGEDSDT